MKLNYIFILFLLFTEVVFAELVKVAIKEWDVP